jgi:Bacterial type II and III secretion system protein
MRLTASCLLISVFWFSTVVRGEQPLLSSPELVTTPPAVLSQPSFTLIPPFVPSGVQRSVLLEPVAALATPHCISTAEKIAHLEKAAEHLAAAGMLDEAKQARRDADGLRVKEQRQIADKVLKQKLADLERLQSEIDALRGAAGHSEQILIHLQVLQVSVTKMREAGFDFPEREADCGRAVFPSLFGSKGDDGRPQQSATVHAGQYKEVAAFVEALRQQHLLKILAEPTLVMTDKRPAYFVSGGELPFPVVRADGTVEVQRRLLGTHVDLVPKLLGNNKVRLAIHSRFGELDPTLSVKVGDITVPCMRELEIDTDFDAQLGQTTVLGEMAQQDAKKVSGDDTNQEARVLDEVRTFFLVTAELVTPDLMEATAAHHGGCPSDSIQADASTEATDEIDFESDETPQSTLLR